jgi:glyoxylase-like metal-dependent hydrolase (beta-lactamase superfamily II)
MWEMQINFKNNDYERCRTQRAPFLITSPFQEHAYWMRDDILAGVDPSDAARLRQTFAVYAERLTLMDDTADIEPGIHYVPTPGHSPGHRAVHIESKDARLLHIVNAIHMPIQLNALDAAPFDC